MGLWLQQAQSVVGFDGKSNATIYTKNGTKSVNLPCGEFHNGGVGIEWRQHIYNQSKKILKVYNNRSGESTKYYNNYTSSKYGINRSAHTSLVIKNLLVSDTGYYICHTIGERASYRYTTMLHVVGE